MIYYNDKTAPHQRYLQVSGDIADGDSIADMLFMLEEKTCQLSPLYLQSLNLNDYTNLDGSMNIIINYWYLDDTIDDKTHSPETHKPIQSKQFGGKNLKCFQITSEINSNLDIAQMFKEMATYLSQLQDSEIFDLILTDCSVDADKDVKMLKAYYA